MVSSEQWHGWQSSFLFVVVEVSNLSKGSFTFIIRKLSSYIYISEKRKKTPVTTQRYQASVWLAGLSPLLESSLQSAGPSRGHASGLSSCWCPSGAVGPRAISLLSCSGALWGGMWLPSETPTRTLSTEPVSRGQCCWSSNQCHLSRVWMGAAMSPPWSLEWSSHGHQCLC